jgi:hypothetical protein
VDIAGNNIFAGTGNGLRQIGWNGTSWVVNTPPYMTILGTNQFNYIKYLNN